MDGIFASDRQRLIVLGMLLENLGIDRAIRLGNLEDWKAAIADLEKKQGTSRQPDRIVNLVEDDRSDRGIARTWEVCTSRH